MTQCILQLQNAIKQYDFDKFPTGDPTECLKLSVNVRQGNRDK